MESMKAIRSRSLGSFESGERLRQWSFRQRSPQQRLDWLMEALEIAYASGARKLPDGGKGPGR